MPKEKSGTATRRGLMMGFVTTVLCALVSAGCCTGDCARDSGTAYARDALQRYVDSGEIPGVISVFFKERIDSFCVDAYTNRLN